MTDEEAKRIVKKVLQVDDDYGDMHVETILVKAGYRAALEAAHSAFVDIRRQQSAKDACETYGWWLEQQVKKEGA